MLAEVAASLPLWAVFVFAASMYPLGLLLPGCPCCSAGCTQCGVFATGYQDGQNENGRMCCTGTIAPSVTLRVTNLGPATSTYVVRSSAISPYTKRTTTVQCGQLTADYVLALSRSNAGSYALCSWNSYGYDSCATGDYREIQLNPAISDYYPPSTPESFPNWWLRLAFCRFTVQTSTRVQTCSGFPGVETCNVGTVLPTEYWFVFPATVLGVLLNAQQCNPAGIVMSASVSLSADQICGTSSIFTPPITTGCLVKIELV